MDVVSALLFKDKIEKVAEEILVESYKFRIRRQRKGRGITRVRRKQYYKRNRQRIKMRQKRYRRVTRIPRKRRRRLRHYKRVG